jgi:hypothetical protein
MITAVLSAESPCADASYALPPHVVLLLVQDGTARLLDLDGYFYALSTTGAQMLQEALERDTPSAVHNIALQYGVDSRRVHRDFEAFLRALEGQRLIYRRASRGRTSTPRTTLPSLLLAPLLRRVCCSPSPLKARVWTLLTLGYLSLRLFGWTQTVMAWQRCSRDAGQSPAVQASEHTARAFAEAVCSVAATHVCNIGCKERALCCWALVRAAGLPATLVLGVDLFPLTSHCWCDCGAFVLSDSDEDHCERFTPVVRYT